MRKRLVLVNAFSSVAQVLLTGVVLFVLYRFLVRSVGVESIGVWSLVFAVTSAADVASFGFSGSVVKFVARYAARGEENTVSDVLQTSAISIFTFVGVTCVLLYPLARYFFSVVLPAEDVGSAISVLPCVLIFFWLTVITRVFQSGLDGLQRIYVSNCIVSAGMILRLFLVFLFVPAYGLDGLAYAFVVQACSSIVISWIVLKRFVRALPPVPLRWKQTVFREMVSYNINFQTASVCQMLFDPVTKSLLMRFGGPEMTGLFEMANRMILQVKDLQVKAAQAIIPAVAHLQEKSPERIRQVYREMYDSFFYLTALFFGAVMAGIPAVSLLWLGSFNGSFAVFSALLCAGHCLNLMCVPAFYVNLGTGDLGWNTAAHVTMAVLNLTTGIVLGAFFGGTGVAAAWSLTIAAGGFIIFIPFCRKQGIGLAEILPAQSRMLALTSAAGAGFSYGIFSLMRIMDLPGSVWAAGVFAALILIPAWRHPARAKFARWAGDLMRMGSAEAGTEIKG